MPEYVVRWRHLRPCGATADSLLSLWLQGLLTDDELRNQELARLGILPGFDPLCTNNKWASVKLWPDQHGGKTECRILLPRDDDEAVLACGRRLMMICASAESVCSWRDQFDRRVGRLYSLALALCELDAGWGVKHAILEQHFGYFTIDWMLGNLAIYAAVPNQTAVKEICADIVRSWKTNRKARAE